jgi:mRNA interferase RelE/StbE
MQVRYKRAFIKDLKGLPADIRESVENVSLDEIPRLKDINEIKHLKKIKSYTSFYRIKIGDYRIGIEYRENVIVFIRVLHRKEIYRYFP